MTEHAGAHHWGANLTWRHDGKLIVWTVETEHLEEPSEVHAVCTELGQAQAIANRKPDAVIVKHVCDQTYTKPVTSRRAITWQEDT